MTPALIFVATAVALASYVLLDALPALIGSLLGWCMLAITVSDARRMIIPDILSLPAIPAGMLALVVLSGWPEASVQVLHHFAAAIAGAGIFFLIRALYRLIRDREGLGLGDVKLAAVAGAWTGWSGLPYVLLLACLSAFCFVAVQHFTVGKAIKPTNVLPFGAFLAPAIWIIWSMIQRRMLPEFLY